MDLSPLVQRIERKAAKSPLLTIIQSQCQPGYGVIFSDGIESDFLEFNAGMTAVIEIATRSGRLVL